MPANANALMQYFIATGMTPEVAAQLSSKVSVMTPPEPPIANGIKIDPTDSVQSLLTTKYNLNPQQAADYAGQILSGRATGGKELQAEALTNLGQQEQGRIGDMQHQALISKLHGAAQMEKPYDDAMASIGRTSAYVRAAKKAPEDRSPGEQRIMEHVMGTMRTQMTNATTHPLDLSVGKISQLPNDIQAGHATVLPSADEAQAGKDSDYFGNIRWQEAQRDKQASDDYRLKLNTDAKLRQSLEPHIEDVTGWNK